MHSPGARWPTIAVLLACGLMAGGAAAQEPAEGHSSLFVEAQRAEARGDHAKAEKLYDQVIAREPANTTALMGRARMRSWLGEFAAAITDYQTVVEREPDNARALSGLGWTYAWNRDFNDARRIFRDLARAEPFYLDARKGLAYVDLWAGNAREARRQFEELAREDQGNPDYVLAIAQAAYLEGDLAAAEQAFSEALALKPDLEAARQGLQAVEAAAVERRPALTLLFGRSEGGDVQNSGLRMAQLGIQRTRNLRLWIQHDRGIGFDGFDPDRRTDDAATTSVGAFYNYRPRLAMKVEAGVRDLPESTDPVVSLEHVFFVAGGITPKIGLWWAGAEDGSEWVLNAGVHRWINERFAIEPTVYFGDDGTSRETRGALLATYTTPRRLQVGLGFAYGQKDTPTGNRGVDRIFGNASYPLGSRMKLLFYGWRESTEGFDSQFVIAAGLTAHL